MKFVELVEFVTELRKLNPTVEFRIGDPVKDPNTLLRIFATKSGSELKLPEGFKYDNNGINNLHYTTNGKRSIMLDVEPLSSAVEQMLLPISEEANRLINIGAIVRQLSSMNPNAGISLGNDIDTTDEVIIIRRPISEIRLPEGLNLVDKNVIYIEELGINIALVETKPYIPYGGKIVENSLPSGEMIGRTKSVAIKAAMALYEKVVGRIKGHQNV